MVTQIVSRKKMEAESIAIDVIQFSNLLTKLYQAPLEDQPWSAFLDALNVLIPSTSTSIIFCAAGSVLPVYSVAVGDTSARERGHQLIQTNPFVKLPEGRLLAITEVISEHEYRRSDFYRLFLSPLNLHHIIGVNIHSSSGVVAMIRLLRPEAMGAYSIEERKVCEILLPHLRQAIHLFVRLDRLSTLQQVYSSTLNLFPVGMIVLNSAGAILEMNAIAKVIVAEKDGLLVKNEVLTAVSSAAAAKLQAMIAAAANPCEASNHLPAAINISRSGGKPDLSVLVRPAPHSENVPNDDTSAVLVLVNDSTRLPTPSARMLADLFGFTAAESSLVVLLAAGSSIDEASEQLGITRNTARSQLYTVFQKAGVNRQSQLVSLIVRSFAAMGEGGEARRAH